MKNTEMPDMVFRGIWEEKEQEIPTAGGRGKKRKPYEQKINKCPDGQIVYKPSS